MGKKSLNFHVMYKIREKYLINFHDDHGFDWKREIRKAAQKSMRYIYGWKI